MIIKYQPYSTHSHIILHRTALDFEHDADDVLDLYLDDEFKEESLDQDSFHSSLLDFSFHPEDDDEDSSSLPFFLALHHEDSSPSRFLKVRMQASRLRANIMYCVSPYDKSIWGCIKDPFWVAFALLGLVPYVGMSMYTVKCLT